MERNNDTRATDERQAYLESIRNGLEDVTLKPNIFDQEDGIQNMRHVTLVSICAIADGRRVHEYDT